MVPPEGPRSSGSLREPPGTATLVVWCYWERVMKWTSYGIALAMGLGVMGCATPRYETPASQQGQACVANCTALRDTCRADCKEAWERCTATREPQVETRYTQALEDYADALRRYRLELDRYEWELWLGWHHGHSGFWYTPWADPWYHYPWPGYFPPATPPADPPTRESVRAELHKKQCQDDCGCESRFDHCFMECGGNRVTETRCIANCPKGP